MSDPKIDTYGKGPAQIDLRQPGAMKFWTEKFLCTPSQLKAAIKKVGTRVEAVQNEFFH